MNNKKVYLSVLLCVLLFALVALAACNAPYTLVFDTNGGSDIEPIHFKKGQKINVPTTTKEYFTFNGWDEDEDLTTPFEQFDKMPEHDVTVYAKWTAGESGKIVFETNGGSAVGELTGVVGQRVSQPEPPTKYGYVFGGWYSDPDFTKLYAFGTFTSGTTTLYARWTKDTGFSYVTYELNGSKTDVPVHSGDKATAPDLGEDVVSKWYTDVNYTNEYNFNLPVNADITLFGVAYTKGLQFSDNSVTGYDGNSKQILIPSKYDGKKITTVGEGAFYAQDFLYVTLPDTVTAIADSAFYKCEYLVNINVTSQITSIGKFAFAGCTRMVTAIDAGGVSVIGENAFADCTFLTEVIFGDKLTEIGASAFINCGMLSKADLSNSVKIIADYAFANSGITSLSIPTSLTQWGKGVVKGATKLSAISGGNSNFVVNSDKGTLVENKTLLLYVTTENNKVTSEYEPLHDITSIAPYAFYGNATIKTLNVSSSALTLTLSSLEGMQSLETLLVNKLDSTNPYLAYWFGAKTALDNSSSGLYVPSSLKTLNITEHKSNKIADYAFYGANGLSSINVSDGLDNVTTIGKYAFAYTALTSFNVGSGLTNIDTTAFVGSDSLTAITVDDGNANYSSHDGALYDKDGETLLYVPEGKTELQFVTTANAIASGALYQSKIGELTVPNSVEQIGYGAFENMSRLSKLTVPFIGGSADDNRYMMYVFGATVTLSEKGEPTSSAENCPASLTKIVIDGVVTNVPDFAFAFCSTVATIDCGDDYETIGVGSFYKSGVKTVVIPDSVSIVGSYAYYECNNMTSLVIGKGVTSVEDWAFASNMALKSIIFEEGDSPLTIGEGAFFAFSYLDSSGFISGISVVEELVLSSNIISIGESAFTYLGFNGYAAYYTGQIVDDEDADFTYLDVVFDVEHSILETVGEGAFFQSGIKSITLPASLKSIGDYAFSASFVLGEVTIGSAKHEATELTKIGAAAFINCRELTKFTLHKTVTASTRSDVPELGVISSGSTSIGVFFGTGGGFYVPNVHIYVPAASVAYYKAAWNTNPDKLANYILAIEEA